MSLLISISIVSVLMIVLDVVLILFYGVKSKKGELSTLFSKLEDEDLTQVNKNQLYRRIQRIDKIQYIKMFIPIGIIAFLFSLLFFRSLLTAILVTALSSFYPYIMIQNRKKVTKKLLNYQLRDALNSISTSLKAGVSLNNALIRTTSDLEKIYIDEKHVPILDEFRVIKYELELMLPIEDVLSNFSQRADLEDVSDFVNVTLITRRQGGNLNEVIQRVTEIIGDRISVEHEINTMVAGKKLEAKILTFLPVVLVILITSLSPDYMSPMYDSTLGKILMIIASLLLVLNYFVGKKIIDIEV